MSETVETQTDEQKDPATTNEVGPEETTDEFKSEESKKAVLADLAKEREQRKSLQAMVDQFEKDRAEAEKANMSDLERAQAETKESLARAEQYARELSVYKLANTHGIQDAEDIAVLNSIDSEEARETAAKRFAARDSAPNNPKPDLTQGASGKHTPSSNADMFAQQLGDF